MGNFEVDTSVLPYGIYDVTIETVIDGKIVTTQHQTIRFGAITGGLINSIGKFMVVILTLISAIM